MKTIIFPSLDGPTISFRELPEDVRLVVGAIRVDGVTQIPSLRITPKRDVEALLMVSVKVFLFDDRKEGLEWFERWGR